MSPGEMSQLSTVYQPLLQKGCEALVMILAKGCDHCVSENAFSSYTAGMFILETHLSWLKYLFTAVRLCDLTGKCI